MTNLLQQEEKRIFIEELKEFIKDHPDAMSYQELAKTLKESGDKYFTNFEGRTRQGLWNRTDSCGYKIELKFTLHLEKKVKITEEEKKEIAKKVMEAE